MSTEEEDLSETVELLRQQITALTGSTQELGVLMSLKRGMTHRLAMMLAIMVKRAPAVVSRDAFHMVLYGDRSDGGPDPKIFNVHISRLRGVLRRVEAEGKIETVWNAGFRASPELVVWVKAQYKKQIHL